MEPSSPTHNRDSQTVNVSGQRVLITGASRGIGRALAQGFAREGAEVLGLARSSSDLYLLEQELRREGKKVRVFAVDLTATSIPTLIQQLGTVDTVIHAAGLARHGAVQEVTEDKFDAVMALNVRAPLLLSKEIIEDWRIQGKGGSIIFISSQLAHVGMSNRSVYSASKSAIEGLSRSLAVELAQERIRVNTVCPTFTLTEMTAKALEDPIFRESVVSKIPLGRLGTPKDYLGICLLLASDAGGFITGSSFRVDGGWTAQ